MSIARRAAIGCIAAGAALAAAQPAAAASKEEIDSRSALAVKEMYANVPGAEELHERARGLLIMPNVVKGGLIVGGAYGEGKLLVPAAEGVAPEPGGVPGHVTAGYYSVAAASFGFQAGVQTTKQALFFMTDAALRKFRGSQGWEVGADAEVTFPGDGLSAQLNTTTGTAPVIAVVFGQDGLLAGASLEGARYTPIER